MAGKTVSTRDGSAQEIMPPNNAPKIWDDESLRNISSFSDAMDAALAMGGVEDYNDFGTGFSVVDKASLIGQAFVILEWRFHKGDFGVFVSAAAVTEDGRKVVINDGSTGICQQLLDVTDQRETRGAPNPQANLIVRNGIRASDYTYTDDKGNEIPATTYYLG